MSKTYTVPPPAPTNHGATLAAWVLMVGVIAGSVIVALGIVLGMMAVVIAGVVVIAATLVGSFALRAAGFGQKRRGLVEK